MNLEIERQLNQRRKKKATARGGPAILEMGEAQSVVHIPSPAIARIAVLCVGDFDLNRAQRPSESGRGSTLQGQVNPEFARYSR